MKNAMVAFLFSLALVCGCQQQDENVVFTCGDRAYTQSMYDADIAYRTQLVRDTVVANKLEAKECDEVEKHVIPAIPGRLIESLALRYPLMVAEAQGDFAPNGAAALEVTNNYLNVMSRYGATWEALEGVFAARGQLEAFRRAVAMSVAEAVLKTNAVVNAKVVDETNVIRVAEGRRRYNDRAARLNAGLKARIEEIRSKMTPQGDFNDFLTVSEKTNSHIIVESVSDLALGDLLEEDKFAFKEIQATPDGGCTKVLEMLDGYVVYHKLGISDNVEYCEEDPSYKLQSLTFNHFDSYEMCSEDDIRAAMTRYNQMVSLKREELKIQERYPIQIARPESSLGNRFRKKREKILKELKKDEKPQ